MKNIANIKITVDELQDGGYLAIAEKVGDIGNTDDTIYGNTLIQIRQRIGLRLAKLIVEEES